MKYTHIGWTPCINGHLNFGLMTPGIFGGFTNSTMDDPKRTSVNYGFKMQNDHHARRIIIQSKVDWQDTPNPETDGKFRVILIAESNETNDLDKRCLNGTVYIYPLSKEPKTIDGRIDLPWFDLIHKSSRLLPSDREETESIDVSTNWQETQNLLNRNFDELLACLNDGNTVVDEHFYSVRFHVNSRGLTELALQNDDKNNIETNTKYVILRQAFYYIKYSIHSHKHHHAEEDSLTTIVQNEAPKKDVGLRIIGQLKRELTAIKRTYSSGGSKVYHEEQGIIAYMTSLYASLLEDKYLTEKQYNREKVYLDSIKESFKVQTKRQKNKSEKEKDIKNASRTYLAIALATISLLWASVIQNYISFGNPNEKPLDLELLESILIFIVILVCLFSTYYFQTKRIITNTLDSKGLRTWVEDYYITQENEFKKKIRFKKFISLLLFAFTASISFFGGHFISSF